MGIWHCRDDDVKWERNTSKSCHSICGPWFSPFPATGIRIWPLDPCQCVAAANATRTPMFLHVPCRNAATVTLTMAYAPVWKALKQIFNSIRFDLRRKHAIAHVCEGCLYPLAGEQSKRPYSLVRNNHSADGRSTAIGRSNQVWTTTDLNKAL
jgi:hypothetical protein